MHARARTTLSAVALSAVVALTGATAAVAGGSDAPTPYDVTEVGITLPDGAAFARHGHVNVRWQSPAGSGTVNAHVEGPGTRWHDLEGASGVTWERLGLPTDACVTWVQIHGFNEHYGEGGQQPLCRTPDRPAPYPRPVPEPAPKPSTPPAPAPSTPPTPSTPPAPDVEPVPEPSPAPAPDPEPAPESPAPQPPEPEVPEVPEPSAPEEPAEESGVLDDSVTGPPSDGSAPESSDVATEDSEEGTESDETAVTAAGPAAADTLAATGSSPAPAVAAVLAITLGAGLLLLRRALANGGHGRHLAPRRVRVTD